MPSSRIRHAAPLRVTGETSDEPEPSRFGVSSDNCVIPPRVGPVVVAGLQKRGDRRSSVKARVNPGPGSVPAIRRRLRS